MAKKIETLVSGRTTELEKEAGITQLNIPTFDGLWFILKNMIELFSEVTQLKMFQSYLF